MRLPWLCASYKQKGKKGWFSIKPSSIFNEQPQTFNFNNGGILTFNQQTTYYKSSLSLKDPHDGSYTWSIQGPWDTIPKCNEFRCFQLYLENATKAPVELAVTPGLCYQGTIGNFTIEPEEQHQISLARVQGHGCNGKNGYFSINPVNKFGEVKQNLQFDNGAVLSTTNSPVQYKSYLSGRDLANTYTWTIDDTVTPATFDNAVAADSGSWDSKAQIPELKFMPDLGVKAYNWYEACFGHELYHPQHVVRLPNRGGYAYFMVAQSRAHNGYISLLKTNMINPETDAITPSPSGEAVGEYIWQDVYTGEYRGLINPIGNWNHLGKMAVLGDILIVAAQNWKPLKFCGLSDTRGTSEDKLLFYDLRDIETPRYIGAMTAQELGVKNGDLAMVEITKTSEGKFLLIAGSGSTGTTLISKTTEFSVNIDDWVKQPNAPIFSGQHGLAFNSRQVSTKISPNSPQPEAERLLYFDSQPTNSAIFFKEFKYTGSSPSLSSTGIRTYPMNLPGADRDWDASSIYISEQTKMPIIYTVKSANNSDNDYVLYQVLPEPLHKN